MELNYEIRERAPKEVRLECEGGRHTLTFPLSPTWMVIVSVGSMWAMAATLLGFIGWFIRMFLELSRAFRPPLPTIPLRVVITWIIFSLFLCLGGLLTLLSYRRRGHIPRCLWIDADKQILGYRQERSNRRLELPLSDVREILLKKIRSFRGTCIGELLAIRLRGRGLSLTFRFDVKDERALHDFTSAFIALAPAAKVRWARESETVEHGSHPLHS